MLFLKEDTSATIRLGPFVDKTDGVTYEVAMAAAMDNATTGIRVSKNGAAFADRNDATAPVYDAFGYYSVVLDATDTSTPGTLQVIFGDAAVCLPCEANFMVVNANVYDSLFAAAATDYLQVDALQLGGGTQSATDLKDLADTGYDPATHKVAGVVLTDTCTTNTDMRGTDSAMLANANGSGLSAIPDMATATNQATIAGYIDTEIGTIITHCTDIKGTGFVKDTHSLPQCLTAAGFSTHNAADVKTAIEAAGSHLTLVLEDTGTTLPTTLATIDGIVDAIVIDTARLFDATATGDADAPVADSIAESLRQVRWFVANKWDVDETATPDTLTIFKDDTITTGMSFQVYTSASHNYRIPV